MPGCRSTDKDCYFSLRTFTYNEKSYYINDGNATYAC